MTITRLLRGIAVVMLIVSASGAALSLWTTQRAAFFNERITLAHMSYEAHLRLSGNTYRLFKQYGDAILIGDLDQGIGETALIREIRDNIREIRVVIGQEINMVGDEELEELELLLRVEQQIIDLIAQFEIVRANTGADDFTLNWTELSTMLEDDINRDFQAMITAALDEELDEINMTRASADSHLALSRRLSLLLIVVALAATITALALYSRQIAVPLDQLMRGVRRLADGQFDRRITPRGSSEIAEISSVMNTMAQTIDSRTKSLMLQNGELEDALRRSQDRAKHTNLLVDDLLLAACEEAGQGQLNEEPVDLKALLTDAVGSIDKTIPVLSDLDDAPALVDAARIHRCIAAMIQNARYYGGPEIVVRLMRTTEGYQIAVEDNGPGLSGAEMDKVFERFVRGVDAEERYQEGAGLGLSVVRSVAQAHGGTARLQDRAGGGVSCILEIPSKGPLHAASA